MTMLLKIESKDDYEEHRLKMNSVSIEMRMVVDDGSSAQFVKMFKIDDFRDLPFKEIEGLIMGNSKHVARSFALALLNRDDCLAGNLDVTKPATGAE